MHFLLPYILESNPRLNLIHNSFWQFLKRKKLVRGSNPHLSFDRPMPTRQTDGIILDVTNALTAIRLTRRVWSGHLTASGTNAPQLMIMTGWRITIQLWVMTVSLCVHNIFLPETSEWFSYPGYRVTLLSPCLIWVGATEENKRCGNTTFAKVQKHCIVDVMFSWSISNACYEGIMECYCQVLQGVDSFLDEPAACVFWSWR